MLTIGMLGGMSWKPSAEYYRLANELVRDRLGALHSARCVLYSVDFADIEQLQVAGDWQQAGEILGRGAVSLEAAGADLLLLCTNTMHKVAEQVQSAVSIPLLHIIDVTASAVRAAGLSRIGLLATGFTMEQDFYRERMASHGVEVIVPTTEERAFVRRVIYEELCRGVVDEGSRAGYRDVIAGLVDAAAEGAVLGCTEIELLIGDADSPVPVFATTRLHVAAAVDPGARGRHGRRRPAHLLRADRMISLGPVVPILRMHDVAAARHGYVDYLGCSIDWEHGDGDRPVYLQVSRGSLVLHLSSHHDDVTRGCAVLIEIDGIDDLHAELASRNYPFLNPGIEDGPRS